MLKITKIRAGNGLATKTHRYVILILVVCLNYGECLTCLVNGKPTLYNPDNQLCCKGLYPRVQNGFEMKCCNGTVYPGHSHQCCDGNVYNQSKTQFCCGNVMHDNENQNLVCCGGKVYYHGKGICCADKFALTVDIPLQCVNGTALQKSSSSIANIVEAIENDKLQTPNVKRQPRIGPIKCPSCITGNHSGPSECMMRNTLHFRLEGIEERKRDRVWLHITVTLPTKYAGRRMTLKTQRVCQRCFKKAVEYVIFTNRWVDSLPEISRITGSDVIVQKDKLSSVKCTIDRRVKAS